MVAYGIRQRILKVARLQVLIGNWSHDEAMFNLKAVYKQSKSTYEARAK